MFQDKSRLTNHNKLRSQTLQNIQYELLSSYIKYSSEQLALKEAQLITQTHHFLEKFSTLHQDIDKNDVTDLCTTEASIDYYCLSEKQSTHKSKDSRTAFKRKTIYTADRKTKGSIADALQQIKEVCSQRTIATSERLFKEHQKITQEQSFSDFRVRQNHIRRKKDRCLTCISTENHLQLRTKQFQEKIMSLNLQLKTLQIKCRDQEQHIKLLEKEQLGKIQQLKMNFNSCKDYLREKQSSLFGKIAQLKLIQHSISNSLRQVIEYQGCSRCGLVRSVKSQIMEYRRFYEREFEKLDKLYSKFKKQLRL